MTGSPYHGAALRRGIWHFLSGKVISAALTLVILLWLVRLLSRSQYGVYATLTAGLEFGYALANLGLPWMAARYVPEFRLHASGAELTALVRRLCGRQCVALLGFAAAMALLLDPYLGWAGLKEFRGVAGVFLSVLVVEGLARFLRDAVMGPLMLQAESRSSMILRQVAFLAGIGVLAATGSTPLRLIAVAELVASSLGLVAAGVLLGRHLMCLRDRPAAAHWVPPLRGAQWRSALAMYSAQLLTLSYSAPVLINLVQRFVGAEAAALFGFVRNLQEQVGRYLPATLLFNLIRPKLMASAVSGSGVADLTWQSNLAGKLSLFVLLPIVAGAAVAGSPLVMALSGGKFAGGGWLLCAFMAALIPFSQRQLFESVAVATGQASLCVLGAAASSGSVLIGIGLLVEGAGLPSVILTLVLGHTIFDALVLWGLHHRTAYRVEWIGPFKLVLAATGAMLCSAAVSMAWRTFGFDYRLGLATSLATLILVYGSIAKKAQAFTSDEIGRIDGLAGRRLFPR